MNHEAVKKQVAEKIWLHYFNERLYERGVINELERNKMNFKIENSKPLSGAKRIAT